MDDENRNETQRDGGYNIDRETLRELKLSFTSIEEIERIKRDSNMYK